MTIEERVKTLENELHDLNVEHKELADVLADVAVNTVKALANLSNAMANVAVKKEKELLCEYFSDLTGVCSNDKVSFNFTEKEDCEQCNYNTTKDKYERNIKESQGNNKEKP